MFSFYFICILLLISFCIFNIINSINTDELLKSMSLEEKIGQMVQLDIALFIEEGTDEVDYDKLSEWVSTYKIGSVLNSPFSGGSIDGKSGWTAIEWRKFMNNLQTLSMNNNIKIPIIYGIDTIHGANYVYNATLFPQALGLAATFNIEFAYLQGQISAKDSRAAALPWIFAPVLGLALQPSWARFEETFGEDPYLVSQMGSNIIKGIQDDANDGGIPSRAAACMKHFIAYSNPVDGKDRSPVQLSDRYLRQLYMPSFQAAIDAGVMTAMESYQEVGGVPMSSSHEYLTKLLRDEMNFMGVLVTDYQEIENLYNWHMVAESANDAVEMSISQTTIDMSMVPLDSSFSENLINLVNSNKISMSRIDSSVLRILNLKNQLGLFSNPIPSIDDHLLATVGQDSDWNASLNSARESITLLKNNNTVLPIKIDSNILVVGPTSDSIKSQSGGWSLHWQGGENDDEFPKGISILSGLKSVIEGTVTYLDGPTMNAINLDDVDMDTIKTTAKTADYVVVCIGEGPYAEKPGDISDLNLPSGQIEFVEQLQSYGTPVIMVIVSGRPRLLNGAVGASNAILNAYTPGPMGGQSVAETIVGLNIPSGRLPYTYPKLISNIPYPYHHKPSDICGGSSTYIECEVEWKFGSGLSYTSFEYSNLILSSTSMGQDESINVKVTVTNTGNFTAKHTVLLFIFDIYRRVSPEYKLLKRFTKVTLDRSESIDILWTITNEDLKYVYTDSRYVLQKGEYRIGINQDTDCRNSDWSTNDMCSSFDLTLNNNYKCVYTEQNIDDSCVSRATGSSVCYDPFIVDEEESNAFTSSQIVIVIILSVCCCLFGVFLGTFVDSSALLCINKIFCCKKSNKGDNSEYLNNDGNEALLYDNCFDDNSIEKKSRYISSPN
jgi:beta-glucosidase